jgi:outer membrane lipoprotein SlyB
MVDVTSLDVRTASSSRAGKSAGMIGGGAAVGAIVGAIAGGGKGAAIGAASGGALGGATTVLTNGQEVKIPSETRLTFRLQYPVQI